MRSPQFPDDQGTEAGDCKERQCDDEARSEPVVFLTLIKHDLQSAHSHHKETDTPIVNAGALATKVGRIENERLGEKNCEDADRDVNVQDPTPTVVVRTKLTH